MNDVSSALKGIDCQTWIKLIRFVMSAKVLFAACLKVPICVLFIF